VGSTRQRGCGSAGAGAGRADGISWWAKRRIRGPGKFPFAFSFMFYFMFFFIHNYFESKFEFEYEFHL
jgi:hypothetical protein